MSKNVAKTFSLRGQKQKPGFDSSIQYECIKSKTFLIFVGYTNCKYLSDVCLFNLFLKFVAFYNFSLFVNRGGQASEEDQRNDTKRSRRSNRLVAF